MVRVGILGAGNIAGSMASTVNQMKDASLSAVASRSLEKAKDFAERYGAEKAYGSYEELVSDPEIDLIYIATPNSHHCDHAKLCIEHGKNTLVEKSFALNAEQAREMIRLAEEKGVLLTEAIWTRYMPSRQMVCDIIASGAIGNPTSLYADLSYPVMYKERLARPELGGGALLDIGVYALNFASMVFGNDIKEIRAEAVLTENGVDAADSITLLYEDGRMAVLHSDARAASNREGAVYGDRGYLLVQNINNCEKIFVYDTQHRLVKEYNPPKQITGYEYEVEACAGAIEKGEIECPQMPHGETVRMMELMDTIRKQMGVCLPGDAE